MADQAPVRFVIFAAPRTGSNLLCSLLNSHPQILCHHGLFNPGGIHYALDHRSGDIDFGTTAERDLDPERFLARVWMNPMNKDAVGFKLNRGESVIAMDAVLRDTGVRKILLERRNRVKTFVSEKIAFETGAWESYGGSVEPGPPVHVDLPALLEHISLNRQYYSEIEQRLRTSGQVFLRVFYESLSPGGGGLEDVLSFLGCPPAELKPGSIKRNTDNLRNAISNFDELARMLRGTEVEADLYLLDAPHFVAESCAVGGAREGGTL